MFDEDKQALVRAVIYPIQFEKEPVDSVDHIFELLNNDQLPQASIGEYADAINSALESDKELSALVPQGHNEEVIRSYLAQLQLAFQSVPAH
jgi:hypothetical protein